MTRLADRGEEREQGRGWAFSWVPLVMLLVLGGGAVALAVRADDEPVPMSYGEVLEHQPRVMPADRVPHLMSLWSERFLDPELSGVSFFSYNRPTVTVCFGAEANCRFTMGFTDVLRSERVGPSQVTVGVINPGTAADLGSELLAYWKTVPLVAVSEDPPASPAWMDEDSYYSR